MDAALDSHFDLGSMYTYSPASKCSPALPHQPSRPPRHDQYEISGLDYAKKGFFIRSSSTVVRGPWPGARRVAGESMRILLQILLRPAA